MQQRENLPTTDAYGWILQGGAKASAGAPITAGWTRKYIELPKQGAYMQSAAVIGNLRRFSSLYVYLELQTSDVPHIGDVTVRCDWLDSLGNMLASDVAYALAATGTVTNGWREYATATALTVPAKAEQLVVRVNRSGATGPTAHIYVARVDFQKQTASVAPGIDWSRLGRLISGYTNVFGDLTSWNDGIAIRGFGDLFDKVNNNLSNILDGGGFRKPADTYVDASGRVAALYDGATLRAGSVYFRKAIDNLGDVLDGGGFSRTKASMLDASGRIISYFNGAAEKAITNLFAKDSDTLGNVADGGGYAKLISGDIISNRLVKVGVVGASTKVLKADASGVLSAAQVDSTMVDATVATASALATQTARIDALELSPGAIPQNGDFESYSSPNFAHWSVVAGTIGTGTDSEGRYIQLNSGADVYSDIFALPVITPLTLMFRSQGSATGSNVSVYVRWYDYSQTFISQTLTYGTNTASATYETFSASLTPPAGARFGIIRLKYEANTPKVQWVTLFSTPLEATASRSGVIAASGSQTVGAQLQLPAGSTVGVFESWINLTLNTNWSTWTTFGANYGFARYRRDALGHVELEVQVRFVGSGTAAWSGTIATLPSGYRPQVKHRVGADSGRTSGANDLYCSIDIDNVTGNLTVINNQQNSGTTYTWVCFRARFRSDT